MRLDANIVTVLCAGGHPVGLNVLALVVVLDHSGFAAVVLIVRETGDEHPAGQRIKGMRSDDTTRVFDEGVDRLDERRFCRIRGDIENKNFTVVEATKPQVTAVVSETAVMGFMRTSNRDTRDYFTVLIGSFRIDTNCD